MQLRPSWAKTYEWFWSKVDIQGEDDCWNWLASTSGVGRYGKAKKNGITTSTHRMAWIIANGLIPEDMQVLHKCDNKRCVNPNHLFLGDQSDNMIDKVRKGRGGDTGANRKRLYDGEMWLIKRLLNNHIPTRKVAKMFKLSRATMRTMIRENRPTKRLLCS